MVWLGLILGIVIGAVAWGAPGAIVLGFIGWLTGLIIKSNQKGPPAKPVVPATPMRHTETIEERVARLERTVAGLEARLAGGVPDPITEPLEVAAPVPVVESYTAEPPPIRKPAPEAAARVETVVPPTPVEPSKPNPIVEWFTGGNTIARVGLLILFIGLAFLLKYAADHAMFPVEMRVASVAAGGIVLLVLGWRMRESRPAYALGLQGAGVAVLYLTTFAALRLWQLIPAPVAFLVLAAIAVFSAVLAVKQDSLALAVIGAGGGFLAPILASTGGGSHVMLFSYYVLLNLGVAAVAFYKAWRPLNLVGFLFTFFIGLAWGFKYYRPEYFDTVEPFLGAFFLIYLAIAILFARKQAPNLKHYVDGTITFGTPLAAFGLQAAMVRDIEYGLAFSALGLAAVYIGLAWMLKRARKEHLELLSEAFLALGVGFATAAIPLALDARWTSAAWALEGAAILWFAIRQQRKLARAFGILLQLLAGVAFLDSYRRVYDTLPLLDPPFVGALLLSIAGLWSYRLLANAGERVTKFEQGLVPFGFAWGLLWWLFAANHEIGLLAPRTVNLNANVAMVAATALVLGWVGGVRGWREATWTTRLLFPVLAIFAFVSLAGHNHPFAYYGWLAWPFAIAVLYRVLWRMDLSDSPGWSTFLHAGGMLLVGALGAKELHWLAVEYTARHTAWSVASVAIVPAILVLLASSRSSDARWPVADNESAYRVWGTGIIAAAFVAWSIYANVTHDGASDPLPYFPLVNALDLAHIFVGIVLVNALVALRRGDDLPQPGKNAYALAGMMVFLWLNGVLLRTLHHWADVPYTLPGVLSSVLAQAALSVFWSVLALALMVYATSKAKRVLWMIGAVLMGVVVVKLFLIDLSHVAGIARIVSFIAVGVLMLVVGYFSPLPPRKEESA